MNIFYCPDAVLNQHVALDEVEAHHLKVLRKKENEELYVFDGKGRLFDARIDSIEKKGALVHLVRLVEVENRNKPKLHVAIALPKNMERFEWFAEKATELGVDEITPIICNRSERRDLKPERVEKIFISACKQSVRLTLPKLKPVIKFNQLVKAVDNGSRKFIAYCDEKAIHLKDAYHGGFDMMVVIGPEGDFDGEEVSFAKQNEFEVVSLGKARLRMETAGIYANAIFNLANE